MARIAQEIADAVALDGLARGAVDDEGAWHVLYLDGSTVRSMLATDWPPPLPTAPTAEQIAAAIAAREAAAEAERTAAIALRQRILTLAQSAVGQQLDALDGAQRNALLAILLWKAGGIDNAGAVRPLSEWVRS